MITLENTHQGGDHGPPVDAKKPSKTASRAATRRNRAVGEMQKRIKLASGKRYAAALAAATTVVDNIDPKEFIPVPGSGDDDDLAVKWPVLYAAIRRAIRFSTTTYDRAMRAELANMYHAAGASELQHLGLPLDAWDITYYSERLQEERYSISQEEMRPWFPLERVLDGMIPNAAVMTPAFA